VPIFLEGPERIGTVSFRNVVVAESLDRPTLCVGVGSHRRGMRPKGSNSKCGRLTRCAPTLRESSNEDAARIGCSVLSVSVSAL
jgi:hypothetical protein